MPSEPMTKSRVNPPIVRATLPQDRRTGPKQATLEKYKSYIPCEKSDTNSHMGAANMRRYAAWKQRPSKRYAILRYDTAARRAYLVCFIRAEYGTPDALGKAYRRFGCRADLFARSTTGKAWYKQAAGYAGHDPRRGAL